MTIPKRNLPKTGRKPTLSMTTTPVWDTDDDSVCSADTEIVKEQAMALDSIYAHDIISISIISEGEVPLKPDGSAPIADQAKYIMDDSMIFL